jgi:hypothetical protein
MPIMDRGHLAFRSIGYYTAGNETKLRGSTRLCPFRRDASSGSPTIDSLLTLAVMTDPTRGFFQGFFTDR